MSQLFCRYCIPRRFNTPFLKSVPRAWLFKSDVYSSDYDDAIVESVLLLNYSVVISLDCLLPADLATYLSIYLLGYQLASVLVSQASCHEIKKGEATMTGTTSVDGTDL